MIDGGMRKKDQPYIDCRLIYHTKFVITFHYQYVKQTVIVTLAG
jgi:hypothetical protein